MEYAILYFDDASKTNERYIHNASMIITINFAIEINVLPIYVSSVWPL